MGAYDRGGYSSGRGGGLFNSVRGSFLIRSLTPWPPNERDRNVDSDIPGKFFAAKTVKGSEVMDLM